MTTRSKDELFQILSNSRRRYIIYYLSQEGNELSLKELATKIAAVESGVPESDITSEERQRVYISLYQTHLPKLEDADIVTYDENERTVALTDDVLDSGFFWMDDVDEEEPTSWLRYYLALSAVSWVLVGGVWLSLPLFSLLGWRGVALVVSLGLLAVVVAQYFDERASTTDRDAGYELLIE
jgi:DNA-binding transcriptional ArsR family regulator